MPKEEVKETGENIFKKIVYDLIVGILFVAFIPTHWIFIVLFILFIGGNIYVISYSIIILKDPMPLIYSLITGSLGVSNG